MVEPRDFLLAEAVVDQDPEPLAQREHRRGADAEREDRRHDHPAVGPEEAEQVADAADFATGRQGGRYGRVARAPPPRFRPENAHRCHPPHGRRDDIRVAPDPIAACARSVKQVPGRPHLTPALSAPRGGEGEKAAPSGSALRVLGVEEAAQPSRFTFPLRPLGGGGQGEVGLLPRQIAACAVRASAI